MTDAEQHPSTEPPAGDTDADEGEAAPDRPTDDAEDLATAVQKEEAQQQRQ